MNRSSHVVLLVAFFGSVVLSCTKNDPVPAPAILGFTPEAGPVSATVTISGMHFANDPKQNDVRFNGVKASVTASTTTLLTVTVPEGATSGVVTVTVNGQSTVSENPFTINPLIGSWRFTGFTNTNCANPADDGISACTLDCPTLTFSTGTVLYAAGSTSINFNYTLSATTLTISSLGGSFSPTYVLAGNQLTLVYPPGDCSVTETYVKI